MSLARLATDLGISASYLNQIEHDTRPLTAAVLGRISEVFGVDAGSSTRRTTSGSSQSSVRHSSRERVGDAESTGTPMDPHELADIVAAHPAIAEAVVNLHRRYRVAADQLAAVTDERAATAACAVRSALPYERYAISSPRTTITSTTSTSRPRRW